MLNLQIEIAVFRIFLIDGLKLLIVDGSQSTVNNLLLLCCGLNDKSLTAHDDD